MSTPERNKLLFHHRDEDGYKEIEVRVCKDDPRCRTITASDVELGDEQCIHLSEKVRGALIEALR